MLGLNKSSCFSEAKRSSYGFGTPYSVPKRNSVGSQSRSKIRVSNCGVNSHPITDAGGIFHCADPVSNVSDRMQVNFALECLKWAEKTPDIAAIGSEEHGTFSYGWLAEQAKRFGNVLLRLGVRRGDRYLCFLPNIPETAAAFLGGQLIGAVPVMVFLGYKEKELEHVFRNADAELVITTAECRASIERISAKCGPANVLLVDGATDELPSFSQLMSEAPSDLSPVLTNADEIAEIIFTSGTTGAPKGIPHTHANVVRQCQITASSAWAGIGPGDVVYTSAPIAFAIGLHCHIHYCFYTGARSLYCTERPSPQRFLELVEKYGVTHIMTSAAQLWKVLSIRPQPQRVKSIKSILVGGSPVTADLAKEWYEAYGYTLQPSLAMTETLGVSCGTRVGEGRPDTLGKPLPGWQAKIVDPDDRDGRRVVMTGETGVLWLKGATVLPFYWNDQHLTEEKIRDGWLNTGDLVYEDEDGYLHHVGRIDELIKSSGWRISPIEIEDVLREHPWVDDVAVVGISDRHKGQAVVAVVVPSKPVNDEPALVDELKKFARERLAGYKVPERLVFRGNLPKTATGKVQRKHLSDALSELGA